MPLRLIGTPGADYPDQVATIRNQHGNDAPRCHRTDDQNSFFTVLNGYLKRY
jgi:hypothetical protein